MLLDNKTNGGEDMLQLISFQGAGVQTSTGLSFYKFPVEHMYIEF